MPYVYDNPDRTMVRCPDGRIIPCDPSNADFAALGAVEIADFPQPAPPVPASISDRQFYQQLAVIGKCTQDEALAAVMTGSLPASLQVIVDAQPADQQFSIKMLLSGATTFERAHPLTNAIGAVVGMQPGEVDTFFIAAEQL